MKGRLKSSCFGAFGLLGAAIALGVAAGLLGSGGARARVRQLAHHQDLGRRATAVLTQTLDLRLTLQEFLRAGDDLHRQGLEALLTAARSGLSELAAQEQKDLQRERAKTAAALLEQWAAEAARPQVQARQRMVELKVGALPDPAKGDKLMQDLRGLLQEYAAATNEESAAAARGVGLAFGRLNLLVLVAGALAAGAAAGVLFHLMRTVIRPIQGVLAWTAALRTGKPFALEIAAANEIGDLADGFSRIGADLQHARREFEALAVTPEASPHPVFELKPDGAVAYANPAARALAEMHGLTPPELLPAETAKHLAELAGKDGLARRERALGETHYDFVFRAAAGRELIFAVAFERQKRAA